MSLAILAAHGLFGGSGSGLRMQPVQSGPFTAVGYGEYPVNTAGGNVPANFPANAVPGMKVRFIDYNGTWDTAYVELSGNGANIMGQNDTYRLNQKNMSRTFTYVDSTKGWMP